ncbi:hypothetical protein OAE42_05610 [Gammaproteobacteria bacterium]|jgi:hypothetical protein|nr:hypothetical protein [Gammaproteobacteria bacterium]
MTTKIIHKKSSVVARVPSAGDLDYGELALNYADGKLYYKNSSNAVKAFIDSAQNVSLITNTIINTVDSDYVLARAGDAGIDSAAVIDLIDSDYVQARQTSSGLVGTANTVILNEYTSDGVSTDYALTDSPPTEHHALVMIDGVVQQVDAYSLSGSQLTLSAVADSDAEIEVRTFRMQSSNISARDYANFVYQPTGNQSVFNGNDIYSNTLAYDVNKLDVYLNGSRLVNVLDYTASNGTSVTLQVAANSGDTVTISSFGSARIVAGNNSTSLSTTASGQIVDTFNKTVSRTAKYIVQMTQGSRYHSQEIMLIHDGTTVSMVEYADIYTESDLGTVDASISGDLVRLQVTPNYTNTTIKTKRTEVGV